jgi:hypothetical protein
VAKVQKSGGQKEQRSRGKGTRHSAKRPARPTVTREGSGCCFSILRSTLSPGSLPEDPRSNCQWSCRASLSSGGPLPGRGADGLCAPRPDRSTVPSQRPGRAARQQAPPTSPVTNTRTDAKQGQTAGKGKGSRHARERVNANDRRSCVRSSRSHPLTHSKLRIFHFFDSPHSGKSGDF